MERNLAGPRRDFDINLDGLAHYGLLPDFLQDIRNQGLDVEDFKPLFRGANDYVEMWGKCEAALEGVEGGESRAGGESASQRVSEVASQRTASARSSPNCLCRGFRGESTNQPPTIEEIVGG